MKIPLRTKRMILKAFNSLINKPCDHISE